jgi:hypothetical protein
LLTNISNLLAVGITCIRLFRLSPAFDAAFIDVPLDTGWNNSSSPLDSSVLICCCRVMNCYSNGIFMISL